MNWDLNLAPTLVCWIMLYRGWYSTGPKWNNLNSVPHIQFCMDMSCTVRTDQRECIVNGFQNIPGVNWLHAPKLPYLGHKLLDIAK